MSVPDTIFHFRWSDTSFCCLNCLHLFCFDFYHQPLWFVLLWFHSPFHHFTLQSVFVTSGQILIEIATYTFQLSSPHPLPPFHTLNWLQAPLTKHTHILYTHTHTAAAVISRMPKLIILCTCQQMQRPQESTATPTHTLYTGAVYPNGVRDVGPCRPMSVLGEAKYFHCEGICSCQQSDRALGRDRWFPWGLWPRERQGKRGVGVRAFITRRGTQDGLFPEIRNIVSVNTSRGIDRVRSGCERRAIATVIQVILHWD